MVSSTPIPVIDDLQVKRNNETLRERTLHTLRQAILSLQFRPGDRLVERDLCERTGVSRTSLREALRHLEAEGLVENIPYRGLVVASLTPDDAQQIYEVRAALESLAVRRFTERASEAEIDELARAIDGLERAIEERDLGAMLSALDDYYETLFDGAGNQVAHGLLRSLRARMSFLRVTTASRWDARNRESVERFRRVIDAIRRRDEDASVAACVTNVTRASEVAQAVLSEHASAAE